MTLLSKKLLIWCMFFISVVIITEGLAYTALWLLRPLIGELRRTSVIYAEQTERIRALLDVEHPLREVLDQMLGWRYRPGYRKGNDIVSLQGLRSKRAYAQIPPDGTLRIAAFGDSFVYGNEVGTPEVWTSQMEHACRPIEVLNYGVGGYGVDQAYLRYVSEGSLYAPHIVLVGFVPDDLRRLVNVYRRFIDDREIPLFKPRFMLEGNTLKLLPNPLPLLSDYDRLLMEPETVTRLGQHDHWYKPAIYENPLYDLSATVRLTVTLGLHVYDRYLDPNRLWKGGQFNPSSEAFRLQLAIFHKFADEIKQTGAMPLIVLFPERDSILRVRAGSSTFYASLAAKLLEMGVPYLDLIEAFRSDTTGPVDSFFMPGGHYSRRGNEIIAQWLLQQLDYVLQDQQVPKRSGQQGANLQTKESVFSSVPCAPATELSSRPLEKRGAVQ